MFDKSTSEWLVIVHSPKRQGFIYQLGKGTPSPFPILIPPVDRLTIVNSHPPTVTYHKGSSFNLLTHYRLMIDEELNQ